MIAIAIIAMGTTPVFAASVSLSPTFSNGEEKINGIGPHGCNGGAYCKADFNGDGVNYLYSQAKGEWSGADGPNQAWVRTNHKTSPTTTYTPTLTTSVTTVEYQADIDFSGNIVYGTGSLADHEIGPELYLKSGSNWNKVASCLFIVEGGDDYSQTFTQDCTYSASGSNKEFRVGVTQKTSAWSIGLGPNTIVDFWNGSYFSEVDKMEICDNPCS